MNKFTALGANEITKNITFQGEMHQKFFLLYSSGMQKVRMCIIRH